MGLIDSVVGIFIGATLAATFFQETIPFPSRIIFLLITFSYLIILVKFEAYLLSAHIETVGGFIKKSFLTFTILLLALVGLWWLSGFVLPKTDIAKTTALGFGSLFWLSAKIYLIVSKTK